ncbi:Trypsin [Sphingomonas sp. EC-HK361]|uniref:S1C family serine protease n=1 Tax=Sphingomonas sp. EC-HK361 TaxID=2038397 RepID=UPI00125ACF8D|nr:serine protease [Sphingomonas sp. EC-HK361]VVT04886.1 Trypsin [Sphingomonas sp. EC-HK361]
MGARTIAAALRYLIAVTALALAWPAAADDISATGRGVVRVVTIAVVDDEVVGFGHGSGFAISPNRIVTNAHVVELAERYADNVVIGIVPSEGDKSFQGKVIAYDPKRDLALIQFDGPGLPAATLFTGPVTEGDPVVALGYPGNVDLATAQSAADYIKPTTPIRSQGVFSGRRALEGTGVLLHTANIARGNSGGPLLDRCGRVIGVNSAVTQGQDGDASFGFAIADTELAAFLQAAKQPYASVGFPCTSIEDRLRSDSEASARALASADTARRDAAAKAAVAREEALADARADAEAMRENVMALAVLMLVAGALGLGIGGTLELTGRREPALWAAGVGAVLIVGAVAVFLFRPSPRIGLPAGAAIPSATLGAAQSAGRLVCTLVPDRSRVTVSSGNDITLDWGKGGCVGGRTQFAEDGARWTRVAVPDAEQTVSILSFDPVSRDYTNTRYLLGAQGMAAARAARGDGKPAMCTADPAARAALAAKQAAIRAVLPPLPNEKLVYTCSAATGAADS